MSIKAPGPINPLDFLQGFAFLFILIFIPLFLILFVMLRKKVKIGKILLISVISTVVLEILMIVFIILRETSVIYEI